MWERKQLSNAKPHIGSRSRAASEIREKKIFHLVVVVVDVTRDKPVFFSSTRVDYTEECAFFQEDDFFLVFLVFPSDRSRARILSITRRSHETPVWKSSASERQTVATAIRQPWQFAKREPLVKPSLPSWAWLRSITTRLRLQSAEPARDWRSEIIPARTVLSENWTESRSSRRHQPCLSRIDINVGQEK